MCKSRYKTFGLHDIVAMKGSNQNMLMIVHLEGTSVLYNTLHCLIKYGSDKIADYSSTLSENAM